jgi:hypothetical protein
MFMAWGLAVDGRWEMAIAEETGKWLGYDIDRLLYHRIL